MYTKDQIRNALSKRNIPSAIIQALLDLLSPLREEYSYLSVDRAVNALPIDDDLKTTILVIISKL